MDSHAPSYHGYRFPPEIISHAVWLYHRFCLSFRDTEDLLAQRGITVSYEAIRQWCRRFGPAYARILRRRQGRLGDTWYLDELFVHIHGRQQSLGARCKISSHSFICEGVTIEDEVFIGHGVAPQSPRFDAPINALAMHIQKHAPFEPGYGGNMLWVCDKPAAAADSLTPRQRIQTVKRLKRVTTVRVRR